MQRFLPIALSLICLSPGLLEGAERIITDSGREVELSDDGSWRFVSDDIFATNALGERIRLKTDGSWEVITDENAATGQGHTAIYQAPLVYEPLQFNLERATIENFRERATGLSKNTRLVSQSVFYLLIAAAAEESEALTVSFNGDEFRLRDSSNSEYELLSVSPASLTLQPGEVQTLEIRFSDSPAWKFGKSYDLVIDSALLASDRELVFTLPLSDIPSIEVDGF